MYFSSVVTKYVIFANNIDVFFNVSILRKNICMVKVITVKVIIHGSIILKMCFKLKFFQMFCSGIEQIACNCLGFWLCFFFNCGVHK